VIPKDEAISVAIQCLREHRESEGVVPISFAVTFDREKFFFDREYSSYDMIGHVRYRTIEELNADAESRFDQLREDDARPNDDPSNVAETRAFIDAMKADHRPHWSITFMGFSDPEHRLLETYSIVRVFDDGHTRLSIIPVPTANGPQAL
jgi:hypothetical protein